MYSNKFDACSHYPCHRKIHSCPDIQARTYVYLLGPQSQETYTGTHEHMPKPHVYLHDDTCPDIQSSPFEQVNDVVYTQVNKYTFPTTV